MPRPSAFCRIFALNWTLAMLAAGCASGPAQWTFQPTPVETAAGATGSPAPTETPPGATESPAAGCSSDARVVQINETAALKMEPDTVDVTKGEKVCFEATNVGGVTHDFHVGLQSDIDAGNTSALVGTEPFVTGTMTVEFTFSGDGPYGYVCVIHRLAGMKGPINLK